MRRYRHVKRGSSYTLLGRAELQSSTALSEGTVLAIYADRDCERLWARPVSEFFDGRFVDESCEFGLVYRPRHYDDWGTIRFANGDMFGTVRLNLDAKVLARHRRENTDPYEKAARRLIESYYADNFPAQKLDIDISAIQYLWIEKQRRDRRQLAMLEWAHRTFGGIENFDPCAIEERARRFLEEAIELCQAVGVTREDTATVADYVFGRAPGQPAQEIGGVMVTLACLAEVLGESVCAAELTEWERVQSKSKAHFEARHRAKMEVGL